VAGIPVRDERRPGARELARRAVKAQVSEMALDLFLENGYEQTTIDDICAVAGISRSTFFRYFPSKEDLFMSTTATAGEELLFEASGWTRVAASPITPPQFMIEVEAT
jgi:AcrR family transcriptional regulator